MKILQISSHYDQGGAARIAACIHRQLLADGEESYVAFGRGGEPGDRNVYRIDRSWEVYASALFARIFGINGWGNRGATRRLLALIRKLQPDVLHLHALHGYYLNFPMLFDFINAHDIPCVWTFHDCHAFVGNCGYFFECDRWKKGCGSCPHVHDYPKSQFLDFTAWMWARKKELFTQGDRKIIVTPSDWLTNTAKQSFFRKYECVTVHNGIDGQRVFYPRARKDCRRKHGYGSEEKLVLGIAVGFDDTRKGAGYLLQLARDLAGEARVILVGWNSRNNDRLEGLENVITLPPLTDSGLLAEYYSLADVFVLPSLAENYATVTLEAMACGTPVVGFDAGGIPEQLSGGKGIAVPVGDQQALDAAVREVLSGGKVLRGEALAEHIRKENSLEKMAADYRELYRKAVQIKHC